MTSNEDGSKGESTVNRRRVIQGIGAAGAVTATSGLASADSQSGFSDAEIEAAKDGYRSLGAVKSALAAKDGLLVELAEEGLIEEPSVAALGIETTGKPASDDDMNVTVWPERHEGDVVTKITVDGHLQGSFVQLQLQPESENAIAFVEEEESSRSETIYSIGSYGCDSSCNDCSCYCQAVNKSTMCDGQYGFERQCSCNDGWA